jgi:hypothetical protein
MDVVQELANTDVEPRSGEPVGKPPVLKGVKEI